MKKDKMLLIDGDWLCFSTAIAFQRKNPFTEELEYDSEMALRVLEQRIRKLMATFETGRLEFHFSCNRKDNWRRDLDNTYKMNREGKLSPIGLSSLISYCMSAYPYIREGNLEADDTIGMAATGKYKGNNIIVSVDKDFLTIPTQIWNPVKKVLKTQSKKDAFKFFIYQTIIGDSSDGYKGIKGVGPKGAAKFLALHSKNLYNIWEPLVELAATKKHDEEYILGQARMAHILQHGDYDWDTQEVNIWHPDMIQEMF